MTSVRLKPNDYNVGALAGKYALKDMSNTGKFSNTVEINPIKVSFEIDKQAGTITVKQGSLLTVPYGFSEVDNKTPIIRYERVNADKSISIGHKINDFSQTPTSHKKAYLVYNIDSDTLECNSNTTYKFYDEDVYEDGVLKYSGNTFLRVEFKTKCALPLGYFDDAWHWHPFTSIGFYKDRMWVDSGFQYYVPRGRKEDYGLQVDVINLDSVVYTTLEELLSNGSATYSQGAASGLLFLNLKGKGLILNDDGYQSSVEATGFNGYEYVTSENWIYNRDKEIARICKASDIEIYNSQFDEIKNFNTYQTVDFAEITGRISRLDEIVVHNDGREETIAGEFTFPKTATFNNAVINGGKINMSAVTFAGDLVVETGDNKLNKITMVDADIKPVISKGTAPNCIAIVGKSTNTKGGIVFGTNNSDSAKRVGIYGDEVAKTITLRVPTGGSILPEANSSYNLGSTGQKFNVVYAQRFEGLATASNWADLAEVYATDKNYPAGTLLQFGGEKELTIAHDEVNAVVSEKPGVLMNAEGEGQPVALAGRVRVLVEGKVKKFQKIYLSHRDGVGTTVGYLEETPIGRALEDKENEEDGLVLCAVHFNI